MKPNTTPPPRKDFIAAISSTKLAALAHGLEAIRAEADEAGERVLEFSLLDFVATNPGLLTVILDDVVFRERFPGVAARLLDRAYAVAAPGSAFRNRLDVWADHICYEPLVPPPPLTETPLTNSQSRALNTLRALAALQFRGPQAHGIQLRTTSLMVGPSGADKSHLVERLGADLGIEVIRMTVSEWIVMGAKIEPPTLRQIQLKLRTGRQFILHIDELDKFRGFGDAWTNSQVVEIFNVIDRRVSGGTWTSADRELLRRNLFVVGSGTWMALWDKLGSSRIGFAGGCIGGDIETEIRKAGVIPSELINRFGHWLLLEPLTIEDFQQIARDLKLGPAILNPEACAATGLGFRAVENAVTAAALAGVKTEITVRYGKNALECAIELQSKGVEADC